MSNPVPGGTTPAQEPAPAGVRPNGVTAMQAAAASLHAERFGARSPEEVLAAAIGRQPAPDDTLPPTLAATVTAQPDCTCGTDRTHDTRCATVTRWVAEAAAEVAHIEDDAAREEQQDQAITRRAHQWCDVSCEDNLPSEMLRNTILYRAIPGSKGALAELERRAAAGARAAALREGAAALQAVIDRNRAQFGRTRSEGQSRIVLKGARQILLDLAGQDTTPAAVGVEQDQPQARVQPTEYEVCCLPEDDINAFSFALTVRYRGAGRWAVQRGEHACLGTDGEWAQGVKEYDRGKSWLDAHRFDLDTALRMAKEAAPGVTVNGYTVAAALAMYEQQTAGGERA